MNTLRFKIGNLCKFTSNALSLYESPGFYPKSVISNIKNKTALLVEIKISSQENAIAKFLFNGKYCYAIVHDGSHIKVTDSDKELKKLEQYEREQKNKKEKEGQEKEKEDYKKSTTGIGDSENGWRHPQG